MAKNFLLCCCLTGCFLLAQIGIFWQDLDQARAATARRTTARTQAAADDTEVFTDLSNHWAESSITRLYFLELVLGYPDKTYKPDQLVNRLETVVLILRSGGFTAEAEKLAAQLEKEAQSTRKSSSRTAARNAPKVPEPQPQEEADRKTPLVPWGQAYVDLAVEKGFLVLDRPAEYDYAGPASRLEVAELLARAMYLLPPGFNAESSLETLAVGPDYAANTFADVGYLSQSDQTIVAAVTNAGVMTGYPDGTFQPYASFSRGEAAVILSRLVDRDWVKVSEERCLNGWISGMEKKNDLYEITLTNLTGERKLKVSPKVQCFLSGETRTLPQANNYLCEVVLDAKKEAGWIELLEPKPYLGETDNLRGSVKMVLLGEENVLLVNDMTVTDRRLPIAWEAVITGDKRDKGFNSLKQGDFVDVKLAQGEVKEVTPLDVKTKSGQVDYIDGGTLYLKGVSAGTYPAWFNYYNNGRIVNQDGVSLEEARAGDSIKVTYIDPFPDEIDDERVVEIVVDTKRKR